MTFHFLHSLGKAVTGQYEQNPVAPHSSEWVQHSFPLWGLWCWIGCLQVSAGKREQWLRYRRPSLMRWHSCSLPGLCVWSSVLCGSV